VVTYLAPAVAVLGGTVLLDEPLTAAIVAGLLLVLAGAWLSSGRRPPAAPAGGHLADDETGLVDGSGPRRVAVAPSALLRAVHLASSRARRPSRPPVAVRWTG
jgi:hypothetical protein